MDGKILNKIGSLFMQVLLMDGKDLYHNLRSKNIVTKHPYALDVDFETRQFSAGDVFIVGFTCFGWLRV